MALFFQVPLKTRVRAHAAPARAGSRQPLALRLLRDLASCAGAQKLHAQGKITFQGDFFSDARHSNMNVSGVIAQQGKEAGYVFDSRLPAGSLYGATYWKP